MQTHRDLLESLNRDLPLAKKLEDLHAALRTRLDFVDRISVAVYDSKSDLLKTFLHSSGGDHPLVRYQAKLGEAGSLQAIVKSGQPRVVNDLAVFDKGVHEHTKRIAEAGYGSSYTLPIFFNGLFLGFIFFNSFRTEAFTPEAWHDLDLFGHLLSQLIANELATIRMMVSTVKAARHIAAYRDRETGTHLERASHYARIIARGLAPRYGFDDEFVELIFLFAPLHDIGKIGLPDAILKKAAKLSDEEFEEIKAHTLKGREIIDALLRDFGLDTYQHIEMLRNIAEYHHEAVDGSGYPHGVGGESIPIEARIIAVADIFDALTSRRRYKVAWTNDEAFSALRKLAGSKLDSDCVAALIEGRKEVEDIQARFKETAQE